MLLFLASACTFVTDEEWAAREKPCEIEGLYLDLDHDGFGFQAARDCAEAAEGIQRAGDCNDADPAINPEAVEVYYDGVDTNCDTLDDYDADGDGYASAAHGGDDCFDDAAVDAVPAAEGDCELPSDDIAAARIYPGAQDVPYDGVDADCSGGTDFDADGDGYRECDECADGDATLNPSATEVWYDGVDQDCDGNDGDQDGDGYYAADYVGTVPEGWIEGDCDDLDAGVSPGESEQFYDGVDADCAGDDDYDRDADGHRSDTWPDGLGQVGDDCDDDDITRNPSVAEDCGSTRDDDCDGDNNDVGADACTDWYADTDGDGLGDAADAACTCTGTAAHPSANTDDCDDGDAAIGMLTWYLDADLDGYGVPTGTASACTVPVGYAATADDCDDGEGTTWPGATESCDAVDSDCDGELNDEDVLSACTTTWYEDVDGDGYGDAGQCLCAAEAPYTVAQDGDCDDADATVSPAATEVCNDGVDSDCDEAPGACAYEGARTVADADLSWSGTGSLDSAGSALAAGGDLDGDGVDELLLGASGYNGSGGYYGMVGVLRPGVDTAIDGGLFTLLHDDAAADFAELVLAPGDLDGDGAGDLLFGVPDSMNAEDGFVARFGALGSGAAAMSAADLILYSGNASREVGVAVAGPGDIDGDGVDDLVVGSPYDPDYGYGAVRRVSGDLTGSWYVTSAASDVVARAPGGRFGYALGGGDVDGDGLGDVFVGAPYESASTTYSGAVYGYVGGFSGGEDFQVFPVVSDIFLGSVDPLVHDVDNDGYADVILGAPAGSAVWVIPGTVAGSRSASDVAYATITGDSGTSFGAALAAGDLDDDGVAELVIGAPGATAVYAFAGPLAPGSLALTDAAATFDGAGHEGFGASLAVLSDGDGDGVGDLVVGASGDDGAGTDAGAAWYFMGGGY